MNEDQQFDEMTLEDFIAFPDTIPLIIRDGSLGSERFRQAHNIRRGTALEGNFYIDYVDRSEIDSIVTEIGVDELSMLPIVMGLLDQRDLELAGIAQAQRHPYLDLRGRGVLNPTETTSLGMKSFFRRNTVQTVADGFPAW